MRLPARSTCLLIAALLLAGAPAYGEGFASVRFGGAFTEDGDIDFFSNNSDGEFDDSLEFGIRGGYWLDAFEYVGVALDVSYFRPDVDEIAGFDAGNDFDVHTIPISLLALSRFPLLRDDAHPRGLLQPYLGVGPSLFVTVVDTTSVFANYHATSADLGLDFVGGLNFQITEWLGLFVEYRFTQYTTKLDDDITVGGTFRTNADMDLDLQTHHVTGGIGFHF